MKKIILFTFPDLDKISEANSQPEIYRILNEQQEKIDRLNKSDPPQIESYNFQTVTVIDDFKQLDFTPGISLGRGSYGEVVVGKWLKKNYAVKCIDYVGDVEFSEKTLIREISILAALSHDNIVRVTAICIKKPTLYLLMELFRGYSLKEVLFNEVIKMKFSLDEKTKNNILSQILLAIMYIHYKTVVHHDLKLANILMNYNYTVKICDFGMSRVGDLSTALLSSVGKKKRVGPQCIWHPSFF